MPPAACPLVKVRLPPAKEENGFVDRGWVETIEINLRTYPQQTTKFAGLDKILPDLSNQQFFHYKPFSHPGGKIWHELTFLAHPPVLPWLIKHSRINCCLMLRMPLDRSKPYRTCPDPKRVNLAPPPSPGWRGAQAGLKPCWLDTLSSL